jgi:tetratricopeptide (TPR) repeat protein
MLALGEGLAGMPIGLALWSVRDSRTAATALVLVAAWLSSIPLARAQSSSCSPVVARLVSLQGSIELRSAAKSQWERVTRLDTPVCKGDRLRTGPSSRAALFIPSENLLRVDQNSIVSVDVDRDETVVEFYIDESTPRNACGAGYAISRFPRKFKVNTPFGYAAVEGTEFAVTLACTQATVSVFEGKVSVQQRSEQAAKVLLASGQTTSVGPDQPPVVQVLVKPTDAVQWALFYPPLADPQFGADPLHAPCETLAGDHRAACLLERAEALVRVGQVNEAQADIRDLLTLQPANADAFALRAVISVVRNEKAEALGFAQEATRLDPGAFRGWMALSYAQQAQFELEPALASAQKAAQLAPASGLAQARVAELLMSLGRIREAERAARQAVAADPKQSRGYIVLGFVQLAQINIRSARQSFNRAIELDSTDPWPRLGLGLVTIRSGNLEEGRQQIEIAVVLDPTNALLRSYLGKAYYEENTAKRDQLAASQYSLAKELDPNDPTPWFYDAILKQTQNQPVAALEELQESIDLNENRAVFRSRLLLDEDQAARSTNLASIYRDLGFDQLALAEGYSALTTDPQSFGAHNLLAEAYGNAPRLETARESEHLQSLLRAPIGIIPVSPFRGFKSPFFLGLPRPFVATSVTPTRASYNNYEPLFEQPGATLFVDGTLATQDTASAQVMLAAAQDNLAMSFGFGRFSTDGFEADRGLAQDSGNLFAQVRASDRLYLQLQMEATQADFGVVRFGFDPTFAVPQQVQERFANLRLSARYQIDSQNTLLFSGVTQAYSQDVTAFGFTSQADVDSANGEMQYGFHAPSLGFTLGGATMGGRQTITGGSVDNFDYDNAYLYARVSDPRERAALHLGVTYLNQDIFGTHLETTNPKLGIVIRPWAGTAFRLAFYETAQPPLVANQTLEPTQFAGFNQLWDDPTGTSATQWGIGLDQRLGASTYVGAELLDRDLDVPVLFTPLSLTWHETFARAYLYRALPAGTLPAEFRSWSFGLSAQYFYKEVDRQANLPVDGIVNLRTHTVPLTVAVFPNSSLSFRVSATYVNREGALQIFPGFPQFDPGTEFWSLGASATYVLPRRHGTISIGISNALDHHYPLIDFDPAPLIVPPEQVAYARFSVNF